MGGRKRTREHYNIGIADCGGVHSTSYALGCRCDACKEAHNRNKQAHRLRQLKGEIDPCVDAGPTRERLLRLRELGYGNKELARFGVYHVSEIINGKAGVRRSTERKVMEISGRRLSDDEHVDKSAAVYLVKRWNACGLTDAEIGRLCGLGRQTIGDLRRGLNKRMKAKTLGKILKAKPIVDDAAIARKAKA